jgi:hypothetical protein
MPNLAFHIEVLNKVIDQLVLQNDPNGTLLKNNKNFAVLGAMGPDMLRYLPVSQGLANDLANLATATPQGKITALPVNELSELFLSPLGGAYSVLFRLLVIPNWPVLDKITDFFNQMDAIAQAENQLALVPMIGPAQDILNQSKALKKQLPGTTQSVATFIGQMVALSPWMEQTSAVPVAPSDPAGDRLTEFLRWHHTGEFAAALVKNASTDPQKAYALGYLCHVAASVTGEPFVNNVTGGPYRTHWWRNRLAGNFIDSWTFGFFETSASMAGDEPTPLYAAWEALCEANLQDQFNVAGLADAPPDDVPDALKAVASGNLGTLPSQFPDDLATLLENTVNSVYPAGTQPFAGFSADSFKQAFVGAFAVYWFMTSGSGPMGRNAIGAPPSTCTTAPTWISSGSGSPPSPQAAGLNTGGAICAVLLAIVALLEFLTGNLPGGLAALLAAINAPVIDWNKVRCELFWLRKTLVDAENALRDGLVSGGLGYPPPNKLGTIDPATGKTVPAQDKTTSSFVAFCRSNALSGEDGGRPYPHTMDTSNSQSPFADLNFPSYPLTNVEEPSTLNLIPPGKYPVLVVNGAGLQNSGMLVDGTYPSRKLLFGDAVSNALEIIKNNGQGLPNYNLDADRGYGWKTWNPKPGSMPATPPVVDVEET